MTPSSPLSPVRRLAASSSLLLAAAAWSPMALKVARTSPYALPWVLWNVLIVGGLVVASVGIARRAVLPQVFSRGLALWVLTLAVSPYWATASGLLLRLTVGALSLAALVLTAPGLDTPDARAEFAPTAYRRLFLSGATAAIAVAASSALGSVWETVAVLQGHASGISGEIWGPTMLAVAYLAAGIGVLRMRAWGVLLGIGTAVGSVVCAIPVLHYVSPFGLAYVCTPGLLLGAPLALSKLAR